MDNTFLTAPNQKEINIAIEEVNLVAERGGFKYQELIVSGKPFPQKSILIKLPNQISTEEEKALWVYWETMEDNFFFKLVILIVVYFTFA